MDTVNRPVLLAVAVALVLVGFVLYRAIGAGSPAPETRQGLASVAGLPSLIELGSDSCASCVAMQKVLAELEQRHAGRLNVQSIDVARRPELAVQWRVLVIPTQVFLDGEGRELARHVGYLSAQAAEARFLAHGVALSEPAPAGE
jgi:thioredoxin 1